ncbi:MAG: hypothetical protein C0408_04970 [Odoribacter sp.]|nr:hypothetical protein [Odoribacter sp.]
MAKKRGWYNMGNLSSDARKTLPEFQKFLVKRARRLRKTSLFLRIGSVGFLSTHENMISLQLNIKKRLSQNSLMPFELTRKFLTGSQDRPSQGSE